MCRYIRFLMVGALILISCNNTLLADKPTKEDIQKELEENMQLRKEVAQENVVERLEDMQGLLGENGWDVNTETIEIIPADEKIAEQIKQLQQEIKIIFMSTAASIEKGNTAHIIVDEDGIGLPASVGKSRDKFYEAKSNLNVSIFSQAIAMEVLYGVNEDIMLFADKEEDQSRKMKKYITQAIFVYQLSSIILEMIDSLSSSEYTQELQRIAGVEMTFLDKAEAKFKRQLEGDDGSAKERLEGWLRAIGVCRGRWVSQMERIGNQEEWLKSLSEKKEEFVKFREVATDQISLIARGMVLNEVTDQMEAVKMVLGFEIPDILPVDENLFASPLVNSDIQTSTPIKP